MSELGAQVIKLVGWARIGDGVWQGAGRLYSVAPQSIEVIMFRPDKYEDDAGYILDRIAALGWIATVHTGPGLIFCCIARMGETVGVVQVEADTRPMAICLAFVQAMERWGDE